ncbi:hypothetical protein [Mongoliitalea daihaiensis]|uniref:hypothetical protein n=1 Tax=Mongoliitalea daihaiensis TaxID=2782006 RepID=UPI001F271487|nr:hypothetical protein [Mongoliitalea daihaiensis]UJP64039.1 hypothetical protein IPZ59_14595 [Mongoliitalea daihaiensis]
MKEMKVDGKYTLIKVSEMLACTISENIRVNGLYDGRFTYQPIGKGKKRTFYLNMRDMLVLEGFEHPFTTDFEAVQKGESKTFIGNGKINLVGKVGIEEVRKHIEEYNLNPNALLKDVLYMGVPVFPELCPQYVREMAERSFN